jgi:simple sugar transport system ATP-binding protein
VSIDGLRAPTGNVEAMRGAGVGFVPRDRHHRAIFPLLSVAENLTITILDRFGTLGLVRPSRRTSAADQKIREVGIVTESSEQLIGQLGGGNQQKTVVARALTSEPKVLVLVAPTQGVDVNSKGALFQIIGSAAAEKMAVLRRSGRTRDLRPSRNHLPRKDHEIICPRLARARCGRSDGRTLVRA